MIVSQYLEKGATAWNEWRKLNFQEEADLSEADLRGADLSRLDLNWMDLSRANLREAHLTQANLSKADGMRPSDWRDFIENRGELDRQF